MIRRLVPLMSLIVLVGLAACSEDSPPMDPGNPTPARVLVLSDRGSETEVLAILTEAGFDAVVGGVWWEDAGVGIFDFDAVVFLTGVDYSHSMSDAAQVRLSSYVAAGGGLVSTEWFSYYSDRNPILSSILPIVENRDYDYEAETYSAARPHPITSGLPASFTTGPDWTWITLVPDTTVSKRVEVVVDGRVGGPAVVTGVHGNGRIVSWGMAGEYKGSEVWTDPVERLLVQIVAWVAQ